MSVSRFACGRTAVAADAIRRSTVRP